MARERAHGTGGAMTAGVGFREAYEAVRGRNSVPAWVVERRASAWQRFEDLGFPTTRQEEWRFTNVTRVVQTVFRPGADLAPSDAGQVHSGLVEWLRFGARCALVFVNGRYAPQLSCPWPDDSVRLRPLGEVLRQEPGLVEAHIGRLLGEGSTAFAWLNSSLLEDGACVIVSPGRVVESPISLVFLTTSTSGPPVAAHPRALVVCGRGSQATVVEAYGGPQGETYLVNGVTEVILEDGARLDHVRVQRESEAAYHVATLAVRQGRDSRYRSIALDLGAGLARTDLGVLLDGAGGECELDGLFMVDGDRHSDTHSRIDHARPHTVSREIYRGILDGRARGVFHGLVLVRPDAQKIDAYQLNKNLILSKTALVHSTPQLQIHADDVRCKHASTTGQIDPAALFYLRSRGIGEEAARSLLTQAFAGDIVSRVGVPSVRAAIQSLLHERLPGAPEEIR
jgi:Fe-S cluster assembly protein SufD